MVDDEVDLLDVSKGLLEGMGELTVETCISAQEALALLQTRQFDVVVSDYMMPGMDGIDFLKIHRGRGDLTPFILFTGKGREDVAVEAINNGADFYLQKGEDYRGQFAELVNMMKLAVQRRRSDQALRESEERYRHSEEKFMTLFQSALDSIFIHDFEGNILEVNPATVRALGYSRDELLKMNLRDIEPPQSAAMVTSRMESLIQSGEAVFEVAQIAKDGSIRPIEVAARVVTIGGEQLVVSFARNITDRKKMEEELRQTNVKLNLLSSITRHDLLNQLSAVSGYVVLAREKVRSPEAKSLLAKADQASCNMAHLLSFTKEYECLGKAEPVWILLSQVSSQGVRDVEHQGMELKVDLGSYEVYADRLLERAFHNLAVNSVKHSVKGKKIEISCEERPEGLVVVFQDDGVGISALRKEEIFESERGHRGLFLVRSILDITGIKIKENGVEGQGARFEILVPKGRYR
ncbi:MAG: PAS domain S-box protein [Methanomassiliicoccales archaeon]|nr:PAS domain S-box protein [Methanomassiliicoccales archaeon]